MHANRSPDDGMKRELHTNLPLKKECGSLNEKKKRVRTALEAIERKNRVVYWILGSRGERCLAQLLCMGRGAISGSQLFAIRVVIELLIEVITGTPLSLGHLKAINLIIVN